MKKNKSEAMMIMGVWFVLCIVFPTIVLPTFEKFDTPWIGLYVSTMAILIIFIVALDRIEKGSTDSQNIFKALTPAQIGLILSFVLLPVTDLLSSIDAEPFCSILRVLFFIGIVASIVLAIIRGVKKRKKKYSLQFTPTGKTNVAGKVPVLCVGCGAPIENDGTRHMGDKYYCKACYDKMTKKLVLMKTGKEEKEIRQDLVYALNAVLAKRIRVQREEERKKLEFKRLYSPRCFVCGVEHPRRASYLVDDKNYCKKCFNRMFAPDSERENNDAETGTTEKKQFDRDLFRKLYK